MYAATYRFYFIFIPAFTTLGIVRFVIGEGVSKTAMEESSTSDDSHDVILIGYCKQRFDKRDLALELALEII